MSLWLRYVSLVCLLGLLACEKPAPTAKKIAPTDDEDVVADTCLPTPTLRAVPPACASTTDDDPITTALRPTLLAASLDPCVTGYSASDWAIYPTALTADPYRLPFFNAAHDVALSLPRLGLDIGAAVDAAHASPTPVANALLLSRGLMGDAIDSVCTTPGERPTLAAALASLFAENDVANTDAIASMTAGVDAEFAAALVDVLVAVRDAHATAHTVFGPMNDLQRTAVSGIHHYWLYSAKTLADLSDPDVEAWLSAGFDLDALTRAAAQLALAIEHADLARFAGLTGVAIDLDTPIGRIVIADAQAHTHDGDTRDIALLIDTGGDDTYVGRIGSVDASRVGHNNHHISIAIDLSGDDTYGYTVVADPNDGERLPSDIDGRFASTNAPADGDGPLSLSSALRQGAARLGIGMLFDLGDSADRYQALRMSQGYGEAGVGVLYDGGGDDEYLAEVASQGAGFVGVGLLLDGAGNDSYRGYSLMQGFAGIRAVGALLDAAGNDEYVTNHGDPATGGDPLYWSIQIPGRSNNSFSQGAAWGIRCDGQSACASGGLGLLRDGDGDDRYTSSVQSQASGYWFGTGMLLDAHGDDSYDARYYVQGAGAHFAMAAFMDGDGNDAYNPTFAPHATSIGVGHDYTTAVHVDAAGNDTYRAPPLSLGSGNANGLGLLVNLGGDDSYSCPAEPTLGAATLSQEWFDACSPCISIPTTGVFLDVGGDDSYVVADAPAHDNNTLWRNTRAPAEWNTPERSVGEDVEQR